nr:hypothetical protein [Tanacetum cinerariifolium]
LLANIDSPVDEKNLVTYAINGLSNKYEGVAGIIRHRDTPPTFAQAQSMLLLEENRLNHKSSRYPARDSSTSSPHVLLAASNNRNNNNNAQLCYNFQCGSCSFGERCKYVYSNPAGAQNGNNSNQPSVAQWNNTTGRVMHGHRITISPTRPPKMSYAPDSGIIPNPIQPTPTWTSPPPQYYPTVTPFGSRGVLGPVPRQAHVVQPTAIGSFGPSFYTTGPPPDGSLSRYKARLIANGRSQQQGIDYDETFSPAVTTVTIRTVLSLVISRHWLIHQLVVKNAFLHGHLIETVYMHQPPGFVDPAHPNHGTSIAYLLIYVDDIILTASSTELLQQRTSSGLFLSRSTYAREVLERAGMLNCNASSTPVATESKLGPDGDLVSDPTLYSSLAGSLQYLTFTRPDISYVVQQAGCPSTRRSTSGYCVFLRDNLISWSSKRQHVISRSSAEAEYRGVANAVVETAWVRNLLRELHMPLRTATLVYCDNLADIFTKGLPSSLFIEFRSSLSIRSSPAPTASGRVVALQASVISDGELGCSLLELVLVVLVQGSFNIW